MRIVELERRLWDVLVRRSIGSFALRVAGTALSILSAVLLARILGAGGYGSFVYAKTWIGVLGVFAPLGLDVLVLRNVAVYQAKNQWSLMRGLLRKTSQLAVAAALALLALGCILLLVVPLGSGMRAPLAIALVSLPVISLIRIHFSAIHGLQRVLLAQIPGLILQPALLVALVLGAYLAVGDRLSASGAMTLSVAAALMTLVVTTGLLRKFVPEAARHARLEYRTAAWLKSALPFVFVNGVFIIMSATDTLMLGAMKDAESVGAYAAAKRGALLITFVSGAVNTALSPTIASLHAAGERETLQRVFTRSMRLALISAAPIALVLILFGDWFLMIFGAEFVAGSGALKILCFGQLAQVALGSVALLLMMTGYERDAAIGAGIGAVFNAGLNAALLPVWGIEGAASATSVSMVLLSLGLIVRAHERIGVRPTVFGVF